MYPLEFLHIVESMIINNVKFVSLEKITDIFITLPDEKKIIVSKYETLLKLTCFENVPAFHFIKKIK